MSRKLLYTDEPTVRDAYNEDTYGCLTRFAYGLVVSGLIVLVVILIK